MKQTIVEKKKEDVNGCYYDKDKKNTRYTLQFKYVKEDKYLYSPISATSLNEAIEEAKRDIEYLEKKEGKIERAYLNSTKIEKERIWKKENK